MTKLILLSVISLMTIFNSEGQKSAFSIKAGIINCTTRTLQIDPPYSITFAGFGPRTGGLLGLRYEYTLSRYFNIGSEVQYILKGHTTDYPETRIFSNHYIEISPYLSVYPFAKSGSKYISCISPEISFDYNYSLGTNAYWDKASNIKFYKSEIGYSLKLTYQPGRLGVQVFKFIPISPFLETRMDTPTWYDYKYSFVSGVSILYKVFPCSKIHKN